MDINDSLEHLIRIDLDALRAYTQAIDNVADADIRAMLTNFRADHEAHVEALGEQLSKRGGMPPQTAHMAGFALAGFTGVAAGMAPAGALMAMQGNEVVTNQAYQMALAAEGLPDNLRQLFEHNLADERRHLNTIRTWLRRSSPAGAVMSGSATMQGLGSSLWLNVVRHNPVATAMAATGAAFLLGNFLLGRRSGGHHSAGRRAH
ncbi:MAG TPA: ferritin-like domain-containing protein [Magnetospirillum sp.]|nr:ferritin-like domain-containing protein [Magnetospirillum sp.]